MSDRRHPVVVDPYGTELPPIEGARVRAVSATAAHVPQIQACFEGAPDYFARTEGAPPGGDAAARLFEDASGDELRRLYALVPLRAGPAVGVLDLYLHHPEPGIAHVSLLLFREACQGLGYGKEISAALEDALVRCGYRTVRAAVGDENPEARAFWERIGYGEVGRLERGVAILEKSLA
jgi:ribosomal protein S18 acetylase RimI-like enzyme